MSEISDKVFHSFIIRLNTTTLLVMKIQRYNVHDCENGIMYMNVKMVVSGG